MNDSERLDLIENQILKYQSVIGKAALLEFLMRYLLDRHIKKTKQPIDFLVEENTKKTLICIDDVWSERCKMNYVEQAIFDIYKLSKENQKKLVLSRRLRNKLLHVDFIEIARLLHANGYLKEEFKSREIGKKLSRHDNRLEHFIALDITPNNDILPQCEIIFSENIAFLKTLF